MGQYLRLSFGGKIFFGYAFRDDGKALARMRGWDSASGATGWPVCVLAGLFARDEGELPRAAAGGLGISAFAAALNRPYSPPLSDLPVGGLMFETHRAGAGAMCRECCRVGRRSRPRRLGEPGGARRLALFVFGFLGFVCYHYRSSYQIAHALPAWGEDDCGEGYEWK
jgi:hypothetical protein